MSYEWKATFEKTNSGNRLFEVCDVAFFIKMCRKTPDFNRGI